MKFCQSHWDTLKAELAARGLDKYVSKSGEEAAQALADGRPDPLMSAHNAIVSNVLDVVGPELMLANEDGSERCPLCYLVKVAREVECGCGDPACTPDARAAKFETWPSRAATDELERMNVKAKA